METKLAIYITGNPSENAGAKCIGSLGSGLTVHDKDKPEGVESDCWLSIHVGTEATVYRYEIDRNSIFPSDGNREGILNFQLLVPNDACIFLKGSPEQGPVSPYVVLSDLVIAFRSSQLTEYKGLDGKLKFKANAGMSEEEIAEVLAPYTVEYYPHAVVPMKGQGSAVYICPTEKAMEQISLDCAYPEFANFYEVTLARRGSTTPALAGIVVPRNPAYKVYINGAYTGQTIRRTDPPRKYTATGSVWQEPEVIDLDFNEMEKKGQIDKVNDKIFIKVIYRDKSQKVKVNVNFEGDKVSDKEYQTLVDSVVLKPTDDPNGYYGKRPSFVARDPNHREAALTFIVTGEDLSQDWEVHYQPTMDRITALNCKKQGNGSWTLTYKKAKKPDNKKPIVVVPVDPNESTGNEGNSPVAVEVRLYLLSEYDNVPVDITLYASDQALTFKSVKCTSEQGNRHQLTGEIMVPAYLFDKMRTTSADCYAIAHFSPKADKDNWRLYASKDAIKLFFSAEKPSIEVTVTEKKGPRLFHTFVFKALLALLGALILGAAAGYVVGHYAVKPDNSAQEAEINKLTHDRDSLQATITALEKKLSEPKPAPEDNVKEERPVETPQPEAPAVDYAPLTAQAQTLLGALRSANVTFDEVDAIARWLNANRANAAQIQGYNALSSLTSAFVNAKNVLVQIAAGQIAPENVGGFVASLPQGTDAKELRIAMQKFTIKGRQARSAEEIGDAMYEYMLYCAQKDNSFISLKNFNPQ